MGRSGRLCRSVRRSLPYRDCITHRAGYGGVAIPALEITGAYLGVEALRASTNYADTTRDAVILDHLLAASREVERLTLRRFFPVLGTNAYRWPPFHVAASWEVWTGDDLLSVTSLAVAAAGQNAVPVPLTHYFLEPQQSGPPYNRVEVDLSSADVFQAGPTPQRSVQITGLWGYGNATTAAGTLNGAINASVTALTPSAGRLIDQGDVLLIDDEAIYVDAPRTSIEAALTIVRGVNGTTPAAHSDTAPIRKYRAPESIRRLVRADASTSFRHDLGFWAKSEPERVSRAGAYGATRGNATATADPATTTESLRRRVVAEYRRHRSAAI